MLSFTFCISRLALSTPPPTQQPSDELFTQYPIVEENDMTVFASHNPPPLPSPLSHHTAAPFLSRPSPSVCRVSVVAVVVYAVCVGVDVLTEQRLVERGPHADAVGV